MLARLRHRAVGSVHDQDRAVHLGGTGDHVLDVVGVAEAVDVGVMARLGLVFHMRGRDRDPASLLLRRAVDLVIRPEVTEILGDRRRQRRLAVVNVPDRADVAVRLAAFKLCLCHWFGSLFYRMARQRLTLRSWVGRGSPRHPSYAYLDWISSLMFCGTGS